MCLVDKADEITLDYYLKVLIDFGELHVAHRCLPNLPLSIESEPQLALLISLFYAGLYAVIFALYTALDTSSRETVLSSITSFISLIAESMVSVSK